MHGTEVNEAPVIEKDWLLKLNVPPSVELLPELPEDPRRYMGIPLRDLIVHLKFRGLYCGGTKEQMAKRLQNSLEQEEIDTTHRLDAFKTMMEVEGERFIERTKEANKQHVLKNEEVNQRITDNMIYQQQRKEEEEAEEKRIAAAKAAVFDAADLTLEMFLNNLGPAYAAHIPKLCIERQVTWSIGTERRAQFFEFGFPLHFLSKCRFELTIDEKLTKTMLDQITCIIDRMSLEQIEYHAIAGSKTAR